MKHNAKCKRQRKSHPFCIKTNLRSFVYDCFRRITPRRYRFFLKSQKWFIPILKLLVGNAAYSKSYYSDVEDTERISMECIATWICEYLRPKRIIDIGCGPGHLMKALYCKNIEVYGVDISPVAIEMVKAKGLSGCIVDLTKPEDMIPGVPYDLAISCEVAEHIEERYAKVFVKKLTSTAPVIFLTATEPQPIKMGLYHFNEQPNSYWIGHMNEFGFELDVQATLDARTTVQREVVIKYLQSPMIFRKIKL